MTESDIIVSNEYLATIKDLRSNIVLEKDKNKQHVIVANYFLKHYFIYTNAFTNEIFIYKDGIYEQNGLLFIRKEISEILPNYSAQAKTEIITKIRDLTHFTENIFDKQNIIVVNNGVIELDKYIEEKEFFFPHDKKYLATKKLIWDFSPGFECPTINKFIDQVSMGDEKMINYLFESIADCLNNHYKSQKLHIFVGSGENGKGTFLRLLEAFFGNQNVSNLGLSQIKETSFQLYTLQNSMVNIAGDTSNKVLNDLGLLKKLTGEDRITTDVKHARKPISFTNNAKMFVSGQDSLKVNEDSHGIYRRLVKTDWLFEVKNENKINDFEKTLQSSNELSGLLNKVLIAYKNFSDRKFDFEIMKGFSRDELRENYLIASNPVKLFVERCLTDNPSVSIGKLQLYEIYCEFCKQNNIKVMSQMLFGKCFKLELPHILPRQIKRKWHYDGIELKEDWNKYLKPTEKPKEKTFLDNFKTEKKNLKEIMLNKITELNNGNKGTEIKELNRELIKSGLEIAVIDDFFKKMLEDGEIYVLNNTHVKRMSDI